MSNSAFTSILSIANRALQHVGSRRIASMTENSREADEVNFNYDMLRQAELRRRVWRFATRNVALRPIDTGTLLFVPVVYDSLTTYITGDIVSWTDGAWYQATAAVTAGTTPDTTGSPWTRYFGPDTATLYDATDTYYAGELVYTPATTSARVYLSLVNGNDQDPTDYPAAWDATVTYGKNDTVTHSASIWQSTADLNLNNTPGVASWEAIPATQYGSRAGRQWIDLSDRGEAIPGATLAALNLFWPLGSGVASDQSTANVYRLPQGYLREAPENPKAGATSYLGAPSGLAYGDHIMSGNYFTTSEASTIIFRFVADVSAVPDMDSMFCEGLACRIGMEVAPTLTQSNDKVSLLAQMYAKFMTEAGLVNGIETGPTEPPEDDYITCRG